MRFYACIKAKCYELPVVQHWSLTAFLVMDLPLPGLALGFPLDPEAFRGVELPCILIGEDFGIPAM